MATRSWRAAWGILIGIMVLQSLAANVHADPMYTITGLGTLPGTTQSIATGINASGQVTGVSYTSSDGTWSAAGPLYPLNISYDGGAKSFLYSNGQMTQINPVDGPANAINDSGQVVGGHYSSINDSGQYVGSAGSGFEYEGQFSLPGQLVSGGSTTVIPLYPDAINNSGEIAGWYGYSPNSNHAVLYQNGTITDLDSLTHLGLKGISDIATAVSNSGLAIIAEGWMGGSDPVHYLLYNPNGHGPSIPGVTDLNTLSGGSGKIAIALNDQGQVVGNGFLYTGGQFLSLQSLLPVPSSGQWSNLVATGINDAGQIIGQGLYDGSEQAFVMTPDGSSVPEPSSWLIFAVVSAAAIARRAYPSARSSSSRNNKTP